MNVFKKTCMSLAIVASAVAITSTATAAEQAKMNPTEVVNAYLAAQMKPDPVLAATYIAPEFEIIFTGGRRMKAVSEAVAFNKGRYKWVKKNIVRTDTVAGGSANETVVYSLGTLYGEWLDGTKFEGNRFTDRFVVKNGKIVQQSVLNDSAEILLDGAGLTKDFPVNRAGIPNYPAHTSH
jgi:hypothetical protein